MSVESEDPKDVREKFREVHPSVDGLGQRRTHLRGLDVDLRRAMGWSRSSPFAVKNSCCLVAESV